MGALERRILLAVMRRVATTETGEQIVKLLGKASSPTIGSTMIEQIDAEIGARVRNRRTDLGISQSSLANHIGVTFQQVQKYEKGSNRIAAATLIRIADKLETSVAVLSGELRPLDPDSGLLIDTQSTTLLETFGRITPARRKTLLEVASALAAAD
ncbi:hypothetical protein LTR94_027849 [Friedmanniomyces endolithicus]|nr:hypothetical protein LTR94_027849 [Friedmanniomyces endolithicus]